MMCDVDGCRERATRHDFQDCRHVCWRHHPARPREFPSDSRFLIVCGGRDYAPRWPSYAWLWSRCEAFGATGIREGGASGGDTVGRIWAQRTGMLLDTCHANWEAHGKAAGPIRNRFMLSRLPAPVGVLVFPGGRGTEDMVKAARDAGLAVERYVPTAEEIEATRKNAETRRAYGRPM
jgi:hypothetical protein